MKDFFKNHYVGLGAGVIATIALICNLSQCSGDAERIAAERIDAISANVDSLANRQKIIISAVCDVMDGISENSRNISKLQGRLDNVEGRVDSLVVRVDTIAARQEKCPCVNKTPVKRNPPRPVKPAPRPVVNDTVSVVRPNNGGTTVHIGNDSDCNTININNGTVNNYYGAANQADTLRRATRRVRDAHMMIVQQTTEYVR